MKNSPYRYCSFDTAIGTLALAWSPRGIAALQLPEIDDKKTVQRLCERFRGIVEDSEPPVSVGEVVRRVQSHLAGKNQDFSSLTLDLEGLPEFYRRVYRATREIRAGVTETYGQVANRIYAPRAARAVGQALGRNPIALLIPCHRVTGASGRLTGFSAFGGVSTKEKLLRVEGAILSR